MKKKQLHDHKQLHLKIFLFTIWIQFRSSLAQSLKFRCKTEIVLYDKTRHLREVYVEEILKGTLAFFCGKHRNNLEKNTEVE